MTVPRHFRNKLHGSLFRALIGTPGWADALIRYGLPPDMRRLLPDTPVALVERSFIDGALGEDPTVTVCSWRVWMTGAVASSFLSTRVRTT